MMRQCLISPAASQDLIIILDYFLERSLDAGDQFTAKFEKKCINLANFPMMGRKYPELSPQL